MNFGLFLNFDILYPTAGDIRVGGNRFCFMVVEKIDVIRLNC